MPTNSNTQVARTDPLRNFKFRVAIMENRNVPGIANLGFAAVSGLSVQNEVIQYREGGMNTAPRKMVGQSDFAPVSFSRGLFAKQPQLWDWQKFIFFYNWGKGSLEDHTAYRCTIKVTVFNHPITKVGNGAPKIGTPAIRYTLHNCWPGSLAMNDLNASDNGLMIQQMTVHHEGFDMEFL
jgi:phage tail-like protein